MNAARLKGLFSRVFAPPAGLTDRQQQLIRSSFEQLLPIEATVAALFFERLVALDPRLGLVLRAEVEEQGGMLTAIMGVVVANSHCLSRLAPTMQAIGRRFDDDGVVDRDYDTVATALIRTLERALAADFTAETREAWTVCYGILADEMKFAANEKKVPLLPPC